MSDAIVGGLISGSLTGLVTVIALVLTIRHENEKEKRAEASRIRERKAQRLREAYLVHLAAASQMLAHASLLPIAMALLDREDSSYAESLDVQLPTTEQTAALRLEAEADRAILAPYNAIGAQHTRFVAMASSHLKRNERIPEEDWLPIIESMQESLRTIEEAAGKRLIELETPG